MSWLQVFFFGKSLFIAKDYKYFCVYYIWDKIFIKVSLGVGLYRVLTYQNIKYYWNICIFFFVNSRKIQEYLTHVLSHFSSDLT